MKKSNKITFFYISSILLLFLSLLGGGIYGLYISIGLSYMRTSVSNITDTTGGLSEVGYNNFSTGASMTGVIVLSAILILLSIVDFICLIRQIVFFKQFKVVRESGIEKQIEKKVKSKKSVIAFAIIIDLLSFTAGIFGFIFNSRSLVNGNLIWVLYVIDALVSIFAVMSFVFLIVKLRHVKKLHSENFISSRQKDNDKTMDYSNININQLENDLIKLKHLRSSKMITKDEFEDMRNIILPKTRKKKTSKQ